jgi:sulfide:quinone oxidoreductase
MSLHFKWLSETVAVAGQVLPEDLPVIAAHGFRHLINNRPDGEGPDQPASAQIEAAAKAAGLSYVHIPVVMSSLNPDQVAAMTQALSGTQGPVFAFCRSGARSEHLYRLATQAA